MSWWDRTIDDKRLPRFNE